MDWEGGFTEVDETTDRRKDVGSLQVTVVPTQNWVTFCLKPEK